MKQTRKQDEGESKDYAGQAIESGDPQITGKPEAAKPNKQPGQKLGKHPKDDITDAPESGRADAEPG